MLIHTDTNEQITDILIELASHRKVLATFRGDKEAIKRQTGKWRNDLERSIIDCDASDVTLCLQRAKHYILMTVTLWLLNDL